jgi:hypothetical protein
LALGWRVLLLSIHAHEWRERNTDGIAKIRVPLSGFIVGDPRPVTHGSSLTKWVELHPKGDAHHAANLRQPKG